jgi:hypothetical protein
MLAAPRAVAVVGAEKGRSHLEPHAATKTGPSDGTLGGRLAHAAMVRLISSDQIAAALTMRSRDAGSSRVSSH